MLYGWALLIGLFLIYAIVGARGAIHLWRLQGEKAKLDEQNYRLQKQNEALRQKITRLRTDDAFLEKIAREELNMVRPGEVIYRFRAAQSDANKRAARNRPTSESSPAPAQPSKSPR